MNDSAQAQAYALADFSEPHNQFVGHFHRCFPASLPARVLDLGCGTADVTLRFARAYPTCSLVGIDGALAMLRHGRAAVAGAGMGGRIQLVCARLPRTDKALGSFDSIISNSLLHHLHDPAILWDALFSHGRRGSHVLIMDLLRPATRRAARHLVTAYADGEHELLKQDFYNSLLAAYTVQEIKTQLKTAGLAKLQTQIVSDRHVIIYGNLE